VAAMSQVEIGTSDQLPPEIRDAFAQLYQDVATLQLKWCSYLELFSSQENATLLSNVAQPFFHMIDESLRNDMIMTICRLSDPSQTLGGENLSLATLIGRCTLVSRVPNVDSLLTAFQSAAGPVRLLRNRRIPHNDPEARILPHEDPLPGIDRSRIDEILRLASAVLKAIHGHFCKTDLGFSPPAIGTATDLINRLKAARQ
jgi:hypothetical protein